MRTIGMVLYLIGYIIVFIPAFIRAKCTKDPARRTALGQHRIQCFCRRAIKLCGMELEIRGMENIPDQPTLTAYSHQSLLDAVALVGGMPHSQAMVAKSEIRKVPFLAGWMKAAGCLFIDRSSARAGMQCLLQGVELLKSGTNVTIAPEGTRNDGGELLEFKGGAFRMALKAEAPILPIAIEGTNRMFEGHKHLLRRGKVLLSILPPIETKGLSKEEQKELPDRVRALLSQELQKLKGELYQ